MTMISVTKLLFCNFVVSDIFLYNSVLNDHDNLAFTFFLLETTSVCLHVIVLMYAYNGKGKSPTIIMIALPASVA